MGQTCGVEPLIAIDLVITNDVADPIRENLCSAARQGIHARRFQLRQRVCNGKLGAFCQIRNFHHRKSFEMNLRKAFFQAGHKVQKVLKWEIRMQASHNVEFCDGFAVAGSRCLEGLF